ncbi:SDR family NAD(P)-dependent oxidoreductase [Neptuniibacter pectenicola]|jgi:short-subunit dehydrogenase|uniref:SDR family NAD(P)-dependent oxidoreductase n=1 Tax=Neptuniibacter pectenicola TaxID=1806669 RepID=UPI000AA94F77|nr:SDR family NAD(P)-dependent oxidoreductase [Neptuniibacter pectenicola]
MKKTILITGSTDGIGLETAKLLARKGHNILIHGRNKTKLNKAYEHLSSRGSRGT